MTCYFACCYLFAFVNLTCYLICSLSIYLSTLCKVGADGVRGKLDYVAAVQLYLLFAAHAALPLLQSSSPPPSDDDTPSMSSTLADVQELAQCLSFDQTLSLSSSKTLSAGVRCRLARLHVSIAKAIFLAQPLVLTLSCDR